MTGLIAVLRSYEGSNDFDTYYKAGQAALKGGELYEVKSLVKIKGKISPFLYSPVTACFFSLFAFLPLGLAAFLWNTVNIVLFAGCLALMSKYLDLSLRDLTYLWNTLPKVDIFVAGFMTLAFLLDNLTMSQVNILIFFLLLLMVDFWSKGKSLISGIVLSFAILIKMTPVLFCVYFMLKREWKLLGGTLIGLVLFVLLIPTLFLGLSNNWIRHRQWLETTFQPLFMHDSSGELSNRIANGHMTALLAEKNQSLEATFTRLFLKDRNGYAYNPNYPFRLARKYEKLPVLGGGIQREILKVVIRGFQAIMLLLLVFAWSSRGKSRCQYNCSLGISLVFLTMTLLSPFSRSHQFIVWMFPYFTILSLQRRAIETWQAHVLPWMGRVASLVYSLQILPYGKAAGMGMWANLILWSGFLMAILLDKSTLDTKDSFDRMRPF
ncbi:MAG: DUF2029 domain-containing protein [Candidatus Omnitrophica bacterium]|nr:DUF2029 domain-containing protein [Candidatus Omnitrophota bacterium]